MHFIFLDNTINFTSSSLNLKALDYHQKSIIHFTEELVKIGHQVTVYNNTEIEKNIEGVNWKNINRAEKIKMIADVIIVCNDENLLDLNLEAKLKLFWMKSFNNLNDYKNILIKLMKYKFIILYNSDFLISSLPENFKYIPKIPMLLGVSKQYFEDKNFNITKCQALVTVHPLRGIDWLVDVWINSISVKIPWAEMHIFSNVLYKKSFDKNIKINNLKLKLLKYKNNGIHIKKPQVEEEFINNLSNYRVHLNPDNDTKNFSSSILESQARGIPIISRENGDIHNYLYHNETGFITNNKDIYSKKVIDLLTDNSLLLRMKRNSKLNNKIKKWHDIVLDLLGKISENIIHR